jgi:hypothetical protein
MMMRILAAGASGQQKAQRGAEAPQGAPAIVRVPMIAFGTDWSGEFDSVTVGPKATVTVYDNEIYREKAATFKPNQKIARLDEKMGCRFQAGFDA